MAGEPGPGQEDDLRLANSLRAGDVIALTEVYDTYAPFLYDYCHGLLRDRVEAAGALRNVVIQAREHIDRLTEPDRLRGWLYAIARKECMRRRDSPNRHTGQEAPEADDDLTDEQLARREERRLLAHSALAALNGRQREAIDLSVRHELDEVDLSGIFGMPLEETLALVEKSREDLGAALHAALIAQNHWKECPSVSALTESWPLSPQAATSLVRHVASCPVCGERETPPLQTDRLLSVLPIAAIPGDLRLDVLTAATAEDRSANRRAIAAWTEPFDEYGWPLPYEPSPARSRDRSPRRRGPLIAAVAVAVGAVVLLVGAMSWLGGGDGTGAAAGGPATGGSGSPGGESGDPDPSPSGLDPSVTSPSPTASKSPSKSPSPSKTPAKTPSKTPSPPNRPEPPRAGRLSVQGCSMGGQDSCVIRITAVGGPVNWRVTGTSGPVAAGGAGHLEAGQSGGVRVSRDIGLCLGRQSGSVTVSPGGTASVSYWC
ncbi:RNA polymerase sigma factor [Actinomadura decatromicini]|uniref:Sigma-70 family RNA polymerase sigma factor n=1 Tax=Actinomadura decatromicini TaxID=2604572 RepID=A0A5D3FXE4_9ACTN|nr:sigma-70 family RNA polymerase sigma factor [Actinomadura decatromicini]TYK52576.1 sigma-70 family RNA polymerase sigma factor [Actinomadura decatromicini]